MDALRDGRLSLQQLHAGLQKLYDSEFGERLRRDYPARLGLDFESVEEVSQLFRIIDVSCEESISRAQYVHFRMTSCDEILVKLHDCNPNNIATLRAVCEKREREQSLQRMEREQSLQRTASISSARTAQTRDGTHSKALDETVGISTMMQRARAGLLKRNDRVQGSIKTQVIEERRFAGAEFDRMNQSHNGLLSLDE
jgi:hypothetical protein